MLIKKYHRERQGCFDWIGLKVRFGRIGLTEPHRVLLSEIPQVKNGHNGRESNNIEIEEFNKQLGNIALELNGIFKWTKVEVLQCNITTSEKSKDGVH